MERRPRPWQDLVVRVDVADVRRKEREIRLSAPLIFLSIDVATIVCAALLGARALATRPRPRSAGLIALIAFAMASGVLLGRQEYGYWTPPAFRIDVGGWVWCLDFARNLTPGLFMLLCFTLFSERRRFPRWLLALAAVQMGLDEPGRAIIPPGWECARLATQVAPALLQTLFAGFALYWTLAEWRFDLVETRRAVRALTLTVGAVLIVATGLLTQVLIDPASHGAYIAHEALTTAQLMVVAFVLFRVTDGEFGANLVRIETPERRQFALDPKTGAFAPRHVGPHIDVDAQPATARRRPPADTGLRPAVARLTALLEEARIWEQEGLTLNALADRVGLPDYRLRKLIHEELGYRNFNALLHDYRIREACRRLSDPAQRRTPILTIALSVGYASINTFSRGFREIMGVTPSAWREAKLAEDRAPDAAPRGE